VRAVICMVSDRHRVGGEDGLVSCVRAAAGAGVHMVQIREKDLDARALCDLVARCVDAVVGTRTRVLVNDRLDIAIAAGAHGVHLPAAGAPAPRLRAVAPPAFVVGRSVHGVPEAAEVARAGGLDYLLFGTVFQTASKPATVASGLDVMREAASAVSLPLLAIGGVTLQRLPGIAAAGASGFAAIALFAEAFREGPDRLHTLVKQASLLFDVPADDI
jgi:thiamine-phosphate diphosphorylase